MLTSSVFSVPSIGMTNSLKIGSPRDINKIFIAHCQMKEAVFVLLSRNPQTKDNLQYSVGFYEALEPHAKPSSLIFDETI